MSLNSPYWTNAQKFTFSNANGTFTVQNNPKVYTVNPQTAAAPQMPAAVGQSYLSGAVEMAPAAIELEWEQIARPDYDSLRKNYHLQPTTMTDAEDNGYYGWLQLGAYVDNGVAQKIGRVNAIFITALPANGVHSIINALATPTAPTYSVTTGGSLAAGTTLYYCITQCSVWGQTLRSPIITVSTGATANAAVALTFPTVSSSQFRRTRLYTATSAAGLNAGQTATVLADVWSGFTQTWTDPCNSAGNTMTATIPTTNTAYLGRWAGGYWVNGT